MKKLFLALLTTLLLLLAATTALAASPSDYNCPQCGEPCTRWYGYMLADGTPPCHVPICADCWIPVYAATFPCTPDESTATCVSPGKCSVCGTPDPLSCPPNPNVHNISQWEFATPTQHYRFCNECGADNTYEYEDHSGGTATCVALAVCKDCGTAYGEVDPNNHDWGKWIGYDGSQHLRTCNDPTCDATEYADHTGGDGSCFPICEVCTWNYLDNDGKHGEMTDWFYTNEAQHYRFCLVCGFGHEYADHSGGTATCAMPAICEGCHEFYGDLDVDNHSIMGSWTPYDETRHSRRCADCGSDASREYEEHYGGTATCSTKAICEGCGMSYGTTTGVHRNMSTWAPYSATQHARYCIDCGLNESYEYEDHYGGTAGCSMGAICEGCNIDYGPLDPNSHLHMSQWEPYADGHQRVCVDCYNPDSFERAPHTGDGACLSACIDCHENFIDPNGEHSLTDWLPENDTQHVRYCEICQHNDTYEYADHVGDGTCTSECKDCGMTFTDPDGTHRLTQWSATSSKKHIRYCPDCELEFTFEFGEHRPNANAEDLPCYKTITCTDCGYNMGFGTQHSLSDWLPYSPLQHFRYCTVGGTDHVEEYDLHYGGDGSCMPVCEGCGEAYLPLSGTHQWGEWTPNADGTHTRVCALNADHTETADCTWGDWTLADDQYHVRACNDCGDEETGEHTGGTATCSSPRICDVCHEGYGSPDNSGMTGHPNPVIEQKDPTCYEEGYYRITCDEPGCSMPFFEIIYPAGGQHLYKHWDILGGGMHHTDCAICGEYTDVACTLWGLYEGEALLTVCPVCGDFGETPFELLFSRKDDMVPIGSLMVRGLAEPIDGALYGFTVAPVYGGTVRRIHGPVTIAIPVECEGFTVVRVEIIEDEEVRTEIPHTLQDGQLTIETDMAGLFLLIPKQ